MDRVDVEVEVVVVPPPFEEVVVVVPPPLGVEPLLVDVVAPPADVVLRLVDELGEESVTKAIVPIAMMITTATTITVVPIALLRRLKPTLWLPRRFLMTSFVRTADLTLWVKRCRMRNR